MLSELHKLYKKRFLRLIMKRGLLTAFILLASISFASAQGLSDLLNQIDEATIILYAVFIISFSLLFFSLNKVFQGNTSTSGIISVVISLLIVYSVNKSGINLQGVFFDLGISEEILMTIVPIIILLGTVFIVIKLAKESLLVLGGLLIAVSFFVYQQATLMVLGIILIGIRFFIPKGTWEMKKKP